MSYKTYQDILPLVLHPSRYIGGEKNAVRKEFNNTKLKIALVFPDLYEIGMSHFGLQILYSLLNRYEDILVERVFAPGSDMENLLRKNKLLIRSIESKKSLKEFDIIGFSLLYELNYTNMLNILELSDIPLRADKRDDSQPLIIAGGPCTCNPEPVANFLDAIVIGDGEEVVAEMSKIIMEFKENIPKGRTIKGPVNDKQGLLKEWAKIEGVYIPSFFNESEIEWNSLKLKAVNPKYENYTRVKRAIVPNLDLVHFPTAPVVGFGKPVHDRLRLEISRGCTRGCRFCQAGMIYRPSRERSPDKLIALAKACIDSTGYEDISLLSLSTGDYNVIAPLLETMMKVCAPQKIAVSFPSLRAGTITPQLMEMIKQIRKTGFTIAPEAGSQRLRDIINKNINHDQIVKTVQDALDLGWQVIKLYFMIGLPGEKQQDIEELIALVKELRSFKNACGKRIKLNVSFTTFIPKAHTPFQWEGQASLEYSKETIDWLKKELHIPGIQVKWQNPEVSQIEGLFARGDRSLCNLLAYAYKKGCKFDGWTESFKYKRWLECADDTGVDIKLVTERKRVFDEPLPWSHIDSRISKEFLWNERIKAFQGQVTGDCRQGECNGCGVCDFNEIKVIGHRECKTVINSDKKEDKKEYKVKRVEVTYEKMGPAKYFGHLEMVNVWLRAIRRAKIPIQYSKGFHPMAKVSFENPLPVGVESYEERMYMNVDERIYIDQLYEQLKDQLPQGLNIIKCRVIKGKKMDFSNKAANYHIELKENNFKKEALEKFHTATEFKYMKKNKKGKNIAVNLKEMVLDIFLQDNKSLQMTLTGKSVKATEIIRTIFNLKDSDIKTARILKLSSTNLNN